MPIIIAFEVLTVLSLISVFIVRFKLGKHTKWQYIPVGLALIFAVMMAKTTYSNFMFYKYYNKSDVYVIDVVNTNNGKGYFFLSKNTLDELTNLGMYDKVNFEYNENLTEFDKVLIRVGFKKSDFKFTSSKNTGMITDRGLNFSSVDKDMNGEFVNLLSHGSNLFFIEDKHNLGELDNYILFYALDTEKSYSDYLGDYKLYDVCYITLN